MRISKDLGIVSAFFMSFTTQQLPRLLLLREKMGQGERVEDWDIGFLHELFQEANQIYPILNRLPEFQEAYARITLLYKDIVTQALANEIG